MMLATTILAFLAAILVLVTVHELGHYLVARWCGVKILRFSVGFGQALISRRFGVDQTEWVLAAIPLGGYVRMLDSREGDVPPELRHRSFDAQPVVKRMAIVFAGPLVNLVLAAFIYAGLSMYGVAEWRPVIGEPVAGSRAAESGLVAGSTVLAVNDDPVSTWSELQLKVLDQALAKADAVTLTLRNPVGERLSRTLELGSEVRGLSDTDVLAQLGLRLFRPPIAPVIGTLHELDKPALVQILTQPRNAITRQYQKLFEYENVKLRFTDDALDAIAEAALSRKIGARGLRMIIEDLMLELMYSVPGQKKLREIVVTREIVEAKDKSVTLIEKAG